MLTGTEPCSESQPQNLDKQVAKLFDCHGRFSETNERTKLVAQAALTWERPLDRLVAK